MQACMGWRRDRYFLISNLHVLPFIAFRNTGGLWGLSWHFWSRPSAVAPSDCSSSPVKAWQLDSVGVVAWSLFCTLLVSCYHGCRVRERRECSIGIVGDNSNLGKSFLLIFIFASVLYIARIIMLALILLVLCLPLDNIA